MFEIAIIVVVLLVIFGASKLRGAGSDLGAAIKGFRKALQAPHAPRSEGGPAEAPKDKTGNNSARDSSATATGALPDAEFPEVVAARSRGSGKPDA